MNEKTAKNAVKLLVGALVIIVCAFLLSNVVQKAVYPKAFSDYVEKYSQMYGVDENLVYAVIKTESSFDENAHSQADARGLMQITPSTFKWLQSKMPDNGPKMKADELYSPEINIRYGTFFLSMLKKEFGSDRLAIAAYHAGRGQVNRWLSDEAVSPDGETIEKIPSRATGHYVDKVTGNMKKYIKLYGKRG